MKTLPRIAWVVVCLCSVTHVLQAQIPQLINYQGRAVVGTTNFDGSGQFKFALVDAAGTTTYWSNDGTSVNGSQPTAAVTLTVTKGLYSVLLGDNSIANMTALPASVFTNPDVRLRVWFNDGPHGSQLLTPDQRLAAVGYAFMADNIKDGAVTSAKLASGLTLAGTTTGTFSGSLAGNASTATTATSATNFTASLAGDVTGSQGSTVVAIVGGVTAAIVANGANLANASTNANTPNAIVKRDASGNFSAGTITASLNGNATTAGSSPFFTGNLAGDVTGAMGTTSIAANTVTGKALTGFSSTTGTVTAADTVLSAINKLYGNDALKAPLASPSFTGVINGNGSALTNLNASSITTGTLPAAQLPATVALLTGGNNFTGTQTITGDGSMARTRAATAGASSFMEFRDSTDGSVFRGIYGADGNGFTGTTNQFTIATWSNSPLAFYTNATPRMTITSTGNVGIGGTPLNLLDVQGAGTSPVISARSTTVGSNNAAALIAIRGDQANGYAQVQFLTASGANGYAIGLRAGDANLHFFDINGSADRMIMTPGGNVGIGGNVLIGQWAPSPSYGFISLNNSNNNGYNFLSSVADNTLYINRPTGGSIRFRENNSGDHMIINSGGGVSINGNLGIGASSPQRPLQIGDPVLGSEAIIRLATRAAMSGASTTWEIGVPRSEVDFGNQYYSFNINEVGGPPRFMVQYSTGNVGIGTVTPTHLLHVNGVARSTQSTWATSSDARVKEDIQRLSGSLEKLKALRPVSFEYTATYRADHPGLDGTFTGFLAQEVEPIFPDMVSTVQEEVGNETVKDFHLLNVSGLLPHVVAGVQTLGAGVQTLEAENEALRKRADELEERIRQLEAALPKSSRKATTRSSP